MEQSTTKITDVIMKFSAVDHSWLAGHVHLSLCNCRHYSWVPFTSHLTCTTKTLNILDTLKC